MTLQIEVGAIGDAFEFFPPEGEFVFDVSAALRVVGQLIAVVFAKTKLVGADAEVGKPLVAKASRYVEDVSANIEFHRAFCRTQNRAARFAAKFNLQLDSLGLKSTPRIHFLECKYTPFGGMVRYAAFS